MGCGVVNKFILKHYYDLFDDSGKADGIYVCSKCNYKERWNLQMLETMGCANPFRTKCNGKMNLHIVPSSEIENILTSIYKFTNNKL